MEEIERIEEHIRCLEIQGARNVAIAGLKCIRIAAVHAPAKTSRDLLEMISAGARRVSLIRVTEPCLRNVLAQVLAAAGTGPGLDLPQLRELIVGTCDELLEMLESNLPKICEHGGAVIEDGSTIFTHCHSSSVTNLIMAEAKRKDLRVICTETRPRWQGRKTARELAESGVDTTLFVDSAAWMYLQEADLVLIGAPLRRSWRARCPLESATPLSRRSPSTCSPGS
jgi:ribose 1,5-bisphosphate isomerase